MPTNLFTTEKHIISTFYYTEDII